MANGGQVGLAWEGMIGGRRFYVPDLGRPVRAALVDNGQDPAGGESFRLYANPDWRALATRWNLAQLEWNGRFEHPEDGRPEMQLILDRLKEAAQQLAKPELEFAGVFLQGLSGTGSDAAWIASFPEMSPRVLGVIQHHYPDIEPLPDMPCLYIAAGKDDQGACCVLSGQLTTVARYAVAGHPSTLVLEPGQIHHVPGDDEQFPALWMDEILRLRLPAGIATNKTLPLKSVAANGAWVGLSDSDTAAEAPWNGGARPVNVDAQPYPYSGQRRGIWLPSQHVADAWRSYMSTGTFPKQ